MSEAFSKRGLESPRLLAEMLLTHVVGCDRLALYTEADRPASPAERSRLRALVGRALAHEPVQYLVGEQWFFSLPFAVDRRVLIPRPSTETILEALLQHTRGADHPQPGALADICTGSGCVAIAALKHLPGWSAVAGDISADALHVARANAERHGVAARLELREGDGLSVFGQAEAGAYRCVTANPPYIPDHEWSDVEANVRDHEPALALRGGPEGLDVVGPILSGVASLLEPGGLLLVEVAAWHAERAAEIARSDDRLAEIAVLDDFEGLPRVIRAVRR